MDTVQMNTRIPKDLKSFLMNQAEKEGRSLNGYLVNHFKELKQQKSEESAKA